MSELCRTSKLGAPCIIGGLCENLDPIRILNPINLTFEVTSFVTTVWESRDRLSALTLSDFSEGKSCFSEFRNFTLLTSITGRDNSGTSEHSNLTAYPQGRLINSSLQPCSLTGLISSILRVSFLAFPMPLVAV